MQRENCLRIQVRSKEIRCTYLARSPLLSPPSPSHFLRPRPVPFLEIKCKFLYYSRQFRLISHSQSRSRIIPQLHTRRETRLNTLLLSALPPLPFPLFHPFPPFFPTFRPTRRPLLQSKSLQRSRSRESRYFTEMKPITPESGCEDRVTRGIAVKANRDILVVAEADAPAWNDRGSMHRG